MQLRFFFPSPSGLFPHPFALAFRNMRGCLSCKNNKTGPPFTGVKRMRAGFLKKLFFAILAASAFPAGTASVHAEDWAFRRSYYSHDLSGPQFAGAPQPVSRSAYRIPYKSEYPGGTVYQTWRQNRVQLRSGSGVDTQYIWQGAFEFRP